MTITAGQLLLNSIMPLIAGAIGKGGVKPVGAEDREELTADACAIAARMLDSAEGKGEELNPHSIAHYALQTLRSGRRSGYAGRRDALCPAAALDGAVNVASLDEAIGSPDDDGECTLHDLLAGDGDDVDVDVARRLDWYAVERRLDPRRRQVLRETVEGYGPKDIAQKLGVSAPRVVGLRQSCAAAVEQAWGVEGLADSTSSTVWRSGLRATTPSKG